MCPAGTRPIRNLACVFGLGRCCVMWRRTGGICGSTRGRTGARRLPGKKRTVTQNRDKGQAPPSTGFQDITAEIGDVTIPLEGDMPQGERVDKDFFQDFAGGTVIVDENAPSQTPEIPSELRVLTGSSPKARPMWLEGLFSSGLGALVLCRSFRPKRISAGSHWWSWCFFMPRSGRFWTAGGEGRRRKAPLPDRRRRGPACRGGGLPGARTCRVTAPVSKATVTEW